MVWQFKKKETGGLYRSPVFEGNEIGVRGKHENSCSLFSSKELVCTTTFYPDVERQLVYVRNIDLPG